MFEPKKRLHKKPVGAFLKGGAYKTISREFKSRNGGKSCAACVSLSLAAVIILPCSSSAYYLQYQTGNKRKIPSIIKMPGLAGVNMGKR